MKKPTNPKGSVTFRVPLYGGRVLLCHTRDSYEVASKALDPNEEHETVDPKVLLGVSSRHIEGDHKSVYLVGWFDRKVPTLAHELVHTTFEIFSHVSIPVSHENDETFAYLLETLLEGALTAMKGRR